MRAILLLSLALACGVAGCRDLTGPIDTGLVGTMTRGPIQPVCVVGVPCDGPLAAKFWVLRNARLITTFESDSTGHFEVRLTAGGYVIAPDETAPVMPGQSRDVVVGTMGLTTVQLDFDTGIR